MMPTHLDNEGELVRKAQMGSTESFGILVNMYERQIYRLSLAVLKNVGDAEDVLQEAFLKAYANVGRFSGEERFYTWLVRIAMNEALTKLRAPSWVSLDEPTDTEELTAAPRDARDWGDNAEESYSKTELQAILSKALEDLETPLRTVFALRDMEGFSSEDTASVLGLSVRAVKARLMRARLKLRKGLSVWFEPCSTPVTR